MTRKKKIIVQGQERNIMPLLRQLLPHNSSKILVQLFVIIPIHKLHLVCKRGCREGRASAPIISMVIRDNAPFHFAGVVGGGTVSVSVLSAHTPVTCLPQGA